MSLFARRGAAWLLAHAIAAVLLMLATPAARAQTAETFSPTSYLERYPISPPDLSSPHAALDSFLIIMKEAERLWVGARKSLASRPGAPATEAEQHAFRVTGILLEKAKEVFDFSQIPQSAREHDSLAAVLQLKEILDRVPLPDWTTIPGAAAGSFLDSKEQKDLPQSWTIPYTDLTLVRQASGDQTGRFLFSAATVRRIDGDYRTLMQMPGRADDGVDLYDFHRRSPGGLMPPRWFSLIENGPGWLLQDHNGQPAWKWLARLVSVIVFTAIPVLFHLWLRRRRVPVSPIGRTLRTLMLPVVIVLCIYALRYVVQEEINLTGSWTLGVTVGTEAIIWTVAAWSAYQIVNITAAWLLHNPKVRTDSLDASLLRTGFRVLGLVAGLLILGYGATQIGIPVYGVVAGLGIGGLAIALAAQPTMENLLGGVILYADQVLRAGDFCKLGTLTGTIETIGIRSTRIRAIDRTLVTVANADLVKMQIINYSRRDSFHLATVLGLRYETTPDQLRHILAELRAMLLRHPKVLEENLRVRLLAFGAHSLDIEIAANVATTSPPEFHRIQDEIYLKIVDIVDAAGSGFAFPSTTAYLGRDPGLDPDRKSLAERAGAALRAEREAPAAPVFERPLEAVS